MKIQLVILFLFHLGLTIGSEVKPPDIHRAVDSISERLNKLINQIKSSRFFQKKQLVTNKSSPKKAKRLKYDFATKGDQRKLSSIRDILKESLHNAVVVNHLRKQYKSQHPHVKTPSKRLLHKLADVSGKLFRKLNSSGPSSLIRSRARSVDSAKRQTQQYDIRNHARRHSSGHRSENHDSNLQCANSANPPRRTPCSKSPFGYYFAKAE